MPARPKALKLGGISRRANCAYASAVMRHLPLSFRSGREECIEKTYARLRRRAEELESSLSARLKCQAPDYTSLVYFLPSSIYK